MSELSEAVKDSGIEITSTHKGFDVGKMQDMWEVKLSYDGRSATFSYLTGIGHRTLPRYIKREGIRFWDAFRHCYQTEVEMARVGISLTTKPDLADVLYSLFFDDTAIGEAFTDWCGMFGYEEDSRAALDTYLQCQANGVKLRNVLSGKLLSELFTLEH